MASETTTPEVGDMSKQNQIGMLFTPGELGQKNATVLMPRKASFFPESKITSKISSASHEVIRDIFWGWRIG